VAGEADAVEVPAVALPPVGALPDRLHGGELRVPFGDEDFEVQLLPRRAALAELVDDLEAGVVVGEQQAIHGAGTQEELEVELGIFLAEAGDLDEAAGLDDRIVVPAGSRVDAGDVLWKPALEALECGLH
jgi:hypothetical protein